MLVKTPQRLLIFITLLSLTSDGILCKAINLLVSIWYEFLLKDISEQTIVQVFFKDMLIFKEQNNIDSLKTRYCLTLPLRLNSSKWKTIYWVESHVIFLYILIVYYYSQVFLGIKVS